MKKSFWLTGFVFLSVLFGFCSVIIGNADLVLRSPVLPADAVTKDIKPIVVIDPGHGGEDGGCSSADGTLEKDLNLSFSEELCEVFNSIGYPAVMTRTDDRLLYDQYGELDDYTGKKKVYDLKNRIRFATESGAKILISIHMNKYPAESCKGSQIYYSEKGNSKTLADEIQKSLHKNLQPDNNRKIKKAGSNIYILNRSEIDAVLCECGFLSNSEETAVLKDPEYRKKLCFCIASATVNQLTSSSEK